MKPFHRKFQLYLIDATIISLSFALTQIYSFFTGDLTNDPVSVFTEILFVTLIHTLTSALFKLNNVIWRYAGEHEYLYIVVVNLVGGAVACMLSDLIFVNGIAGVYYILGECVALSVLLMARIFYREIVSHDHRYIFSPDSKRLLIIGAGSAGLRLLDEIKSNPSCGLAPIGFIDQNPQKLYRTINGIMVLGSLGDLKAICENERIDIIYLAIPSLSNEKRAEIIDECLETNCAVKILPLVSEITDKNNLINSIRDITPEELLGREPIKIVDDEIIHFMKGKKVIITGGGGSIGSEICRQIAANSPKRLVIVDIYENNAYSIQQELIGRYGDTLDLEVFIATVCDYGKINRIIADEKPDLIVHAAAHKHVPLMETVPDEAVKNNVFGTLNTVMAARANKIPKMILISTDKAVNPTNIMGATKRICEMIIQYADTISPDTTFAAVRFGNVLGSNGSVIPLFKKQIEEHHDVTVTHSEMIRYFMTISEASQLVLTASAMANGGEIFVLDMGEPVKIDDLAKNMIRLSGLTLGKDINIRYIGLRPGEKLYEELLMGEEGLHKTPNRKIFIGKTISMDYEIFKRQLDELEIIVNDPDNLSSDVEKKLMEIVHTFRRNPIVSGPDMKKVPDVPGFTDEIKGYSYADV